MLVELRMQSVDRLSPHVSVAGALRVDDLAEAARRGFRTIVNFQPDGESSKQLRSAEARAAAQLAGLTYLHIPASKYELFTDDIVHRAQAAFNDSDAPLLAVCASGQRAAIIWAAAEARRQRPVADILAGLAAAGFDFAFLRDDLDAQADRSRWSCGSDPAAMREIEELSAA